MPIGAAGGRPRLARSAVAGLPPLPCCCHSGECGLGSQLCSGEKGRRTNQSNTNDNDENASSPRWQAERDCTTLLPQKKERERERERDKNARIDQLGLLLDLSSTCIWHSIPPSLPPPNTISPLEQLCLCPAGIRSTAKNIRTIGWLHGPSPSPCF